MGYTTTFAGCLRIDPPLKWEQRDEVNQFCSEDHRTAGFPGIWCDWQVNEAGDRIGWNENEKSYEMAAWIRYLIQTRFSPWGRKLNGRVLAEGEERNDVWLLMVTENVVSTAAVPPPNLPSVTE
jgi:hypothetical protein